MEPLFIAHWNVKQCSTVESSRVVPQNTHTHTHTHTHTEIPYDPTILLLGIYPQNLRRIQTDIFIQAFIATLFTIAKMKKQPKYPSMDE